jgi:hypothetical protein
VGFAESDTTLQKQRIVGLGGVIGDGHTGSTRQTITRTDDKSVKRKALIEHAPGGSSEKITLGWGISVNGWR